jgi:hypothetical protein
MPRHVHQVAARDFADFVDTVGELVASVLDVHGGVAVRDVAAVDIGDARHFFSLEGGPIGRC